LVRDLSRGREIADDGVPRDLGLGNPSFPGPPLERPGERRRKPKR
jgi:hypothetical protein